MLLISQCETFSLENCLWVAQHCVATSQKVRLKSALEASQHLQAATTLD